MRPDMGKIVVDAYRFHEWGDSKFSKKKQKHRKGLDERPTKESMSRTRYGTKELGDNLKPLYRWLYKQVGRKWDVVYSELVASLNGGYANLEHIKEHALNKVERGEIRTIDGWPCVMLKFSNRDDPWHALNRKDLYVNENGIIKVPPRNKMTPSEKRRQERRRRPQIVMLDGLTAAAKIDGTWFVADLTPVPLYETKTIDYFRTSRNGPTVMKKSMERRRVVDVLLDRVIRSYKDEFAHENVPYDTMNLYAPSIRTMSKKEIKQRISEELR